MAGSILGAPAVQNYLDLAMSLYGGFQDQEALNRANAQNELRYGQGLTEAIGLRDRIVGNVQQNQDEYMPWLGQNLTGLSDQSALIGSHIAGGYGDLRDRAMGDYNAGANQTGIGYSNLGSSITGQIDEGYGQLGGQYGDRTRQALSYLDGSGAQQLADINERFQGIGSQLESDLIGRGLSSSTMLGSTRRGVERERSAEQRRLQEGLRREYLDAYGQFSGDELSARERGLQSRIGYGSEIGMAGLSAGERMNQQRLMNDQSLTNNYLGAQEQGMLRTYGQDAANIAAMGGAWQDYQNQLQQADVYGTQNIGNIIGSRTDSVAQSPFSAAAQNWGGAGNGGGGGGGGGSSGYGPALIGAAGSIGAAGVGAWGAGVAASAVFFICVDQRATVTTNHGDMDLCHVEIGDHVRGEDGFFHKCIEKHFEVREKHTRGPMHKITLSSGDSIVLTDNHPIGGVRAGLLKVGDIVKHWNGEFTVESNIEVPYVPSGDIMLEDNVRYMANGFPVDSVIGMYGAERFRKMRDGLKELMETK